MRGAAPGATGRRARWIPVGLAVLSGLLYELAFPGLDQFYFAFVAFVPVLWASHRASAKRALFLGVIVGLVSHMIAYYWVIHMIQTFAFMPWIVGALVWLVVCVGQGTSYGVGLGLAQWLRRKTGWPYALTLAVGLTAMDFCYPMVFPSYIANTMNGVPWMMQVVDLFGVLGLTALIGAINGAVVDVIAARQAGRPWPVRTVATVGCLWLATLGYGAWRTHQVDREAAAAPKLKVGLVQADFGGIENLHEQEESLVAHRKLTAELAAKGVDLVVWPEGATDVPLALGMNVRNGIFGGAHDPPVLFGAIRTDRDPASPAGIIPFNTAFLTDRTGKVIGYYDKEVLLVFGEYIPLGDWFPKLYDWIQNASHWGRGTSTAPLVLGSWRLGTFICYEDILPRYVQKIMAPHNGLRPNLMVNITNDSWYGPYLEQAEHLGLAAFRAVEHHRALVRDTSTGISAIIDPAGRIVKRTKIFQQATLVASVPQMNGTTLYEEVGDLMGYLALAILAAVWLRGRRRAKGSSPIAAQ